MGPAAGVHGSRARGYTPSMGYADLDELRAHWDAFAGLFEQRFEPATVLLARSLAAHLRLAEAEAVLEVGAGPGAGALALSQDMPPHARLTITDIAPNMVALARARLPAAVEVCEANAEALPFEDGAFDRLLANLSLMLVLDPDQALAEAHRVLRPGGLAAWSVWGRPEPSSLFTLPAQAAARAGIELPASSRSNFHLGDRDALRARIQGHGFAHTLAWYQTMTMPVQGGAHYADIVLRTPRWQKNLDALPAETVTVFRRTLADLAGEHLAAGQPIALDALVVVARRA